MRAIVIQYLFEKETTKQQIAVQACSVTPTWKKTVIFAASFRFQYVSDAWNSISTFDVQTTPPPCVVGDTFIQHPQLTIHTRW